MTKPSFKTHKKSCGFLRVNDQKTSKENSFECNKARNCAIYKICNPFILSIRYEDKHGHKQKSLGRIKKHNPNRESAHSSDSAHWGRV